MAKESKTTKKQTGNHRHAMSLENREQQMITLAVDLAEQQLREGTASSQLITHYLKLATTREKIEQETMIANKKLIQAKVENLQSASRVEELYAEAISAMKRYGGNTESTSSDDEEDYDD
jgi:hypothetical protein